MAAPAQLRQVGQLLDADDAVIEGGLQALGNSISQDDGNHDRQNVGNLAGELKDDHSCGHCVCHRSCKCSCPWEQPCSVSSGCSLPKRLFPFPEPRLLSVPQGLWPYQQGAPEPQSLPGPGPPTTKRQTWGHCWDCKYITACATPWVWSPASQSKQNWVLTNHGIASRYNPVGAAICVNPVWEPGGHAFTHQPPKCCSFREGFRKRKR